MAAATDPAARNTDNMPWPVVHGAAAVMFVAFGNAYAVVVFFPDIAADLAAPPWLLTALFSITGALYFTIGAVSGHLTDRYGARPVVAVGMCVLALGLLLASQASTVWSFAPAYVLGIGGGVGLSYVPSSAAVQLRGGIHGALAGGLASSGIGFGTMLVPPVSAFLISQVGWRAALAGLALLAVLGLIGCLPLGHTASEPRAIARRHTDLHSTRFAVLYAAYVCVGLVAFVPIAEAVPFMASRGLTSADAVSTLVMIGCGSILGRCGFGYLADKVGARRASVQCAAFMFASFTVMAGQDDADFLRLAALLFGLGYGGITGLTAATAAEIMGVGHFGSTLGTLMTSRALGILCGPWLVALIADELGGFTVPFLICAALAGLAGALLHMERVHAPAASRAIARP